MKKYLVPLFLMAVTLLSPAFLHAEGVAIKRIYKWTYAGRAFIMEYNFQGDNHNFYKGLKRSYKNYADYTNESSIHPVISRFTRSIRQQAAAQNLTEWQTIELAMRFVQSLRYESDSKHEYPKFPIETLVDMAGDCEDTSILLAAILEEMGYDCIMISPKGHMAVGLACDNCDGTFFEKNGQRYFYIETTDLGWDIGTMPRKYKELTCKLIDVDCSVDKGCVFEANQGEEAKPQYKEILVKKVINGRTYMVRQRVKVS